MAPLLFAGATVPITIHLWKWAVLQEVLRFRAGSHFAAVAAAVAVELCLGRVKQCFQNCGFFQNGWFALRIELLRRHADQTDRQANTD